MRGYEEIKSKFIMGVFGVNFMIYEMYFFGVSIFIFIEFKGYY